MAMKGLVSTEIIRLIRNGVEGGMEVTGEGDRDYNIPVATLSPPE